MGVIFTISVIFLETLTAILAFTAFCFLWREYWLRRQRHLLFFALAFISIGIGYTLLFVGQVLFAYKDSGLAEAFLRSIMYAYAIESLWIMLGLFELYVPKSRGGLLLLLSLGVPTASFVASLLSSYLVFNSSGYAAPFLDLRQYLMSFGAVALAGLALVAIRFRRAETERRKKPDAYFVRAGAVLLVFFALCLFAIYFEILVLMTIATVLQLTFFVFLFLAAVAKDHPEKLIVDRPSAFVSRRLILKAAGLNAALFWVLAYLLLAVTSTYFVTASIDARRLGLRRDAHFFSRSFASSGALFLEETSRLAGIPVLPSIVGREPAEVPPQLSEFLRFDGQRRIMRIVDREGRVIYSSFSMKEVGIVLDSAVVRKALGGEKVAATEHEDAISAWAIRAAVPIALSDGAVGGVVLATDLASALDFSDYLAISPVLANGYGYVAESGELAYAVGESVDQLEKTSFRRMLGTQASYSGPESNGDEVFLEHTYATDGTPNGFFYVVLRRAMLDSEVFRILSTVALITLLALVSMTAFLLFSMSTVLRPIKELRSASQRVEKDDYGVHVLYRTPDELGELANAFNHMSGAIADRTSSLRQALREQQDFLENTTRELRTPLNIFRWTLEMMRFGDTGRLNKEQLELIEQLNQTNERLIRMVQKLQDAIKIDQRRLVLKIQDVVVEDVIDEVAGAMAVKSRKKNLALHWNRPKTAMPRAYADSDYLRKVVANLVGNAVKYTPENGHIEVDIEETDEVAPGGKKGKYLKITVEDNGIGIAKEDLGRVFTRFFRGKNVSGTESEGTGLGLFIAKQIVELHGGRIWLESREGVGTTVAFTVPTERPQLARNGNPTKQA